MSYEFGMHLKTCGIVSQLTPPGTPQRNGVSERRNRTLLDTSKDAHPLQRFQHDICLVQPPVYNNSYVQRVHNNSQCIIIVQ